jgi:hypothetical protein
MKCLNWQDSDDCVRSIGTKQGAKESKDVWDEKWYENPMIAIRHEEFEGEYDTRYAHVNSLYNHHLNANGDFLSITHILNQSDQIEMVCLELPSGTANLTQNSSTNA